MKKNWDSFGWDDFWSGVAGILTNTTSTSVHRREALPLGPGSHGMVFRRAPAKQSNSQATPGVKPSIFNRCSLISSGLESLDAALGDTAFMHGDINAFD